MTNKTLRKRSVACAGLLFIFVCQACAVAPLDSTRGKTAATAKSNSARVTAAQSQQSESSEDQVLLAVSKAIRKAHLTDRPDECLAYGFDSNASKEAYFVEVRENHRHASCGGDPETQPRLFTVKVDRKTRRMFTDQGSPGQFRAIQN